MDVAEQSLRQDWPVSATGHTAARAFVEELYARHHREIYAYLARMLRDPELAADLTQDAFVKAYRAYESLEDPAHARAWLYQIAHRVALDDLRRRKIIRFLPWTGESRGSSPSAEHLVMETRLSGDLQRALDRIPERQRAALLLAEVHDLTGLELAAALGVSHVAARALLTRARESLRQALAAERQATIDAEAARDSERKLAESRDRRGGGEPLSEQSRRRAHTRALGLGPRARASPGGGTTGAAVALRRTAWLDRHLRSCPPCASIAADYAAQQSALALPRGAPPATRPVGANGNGTRSGRPPGPGPPGRIRFPGPWWCSREPRLALDSRPARRASGDRIPDVAEGDSAAPDGHAAGTPAPQRLGMARSVRRPGGHGPRDHRRRQRDPVRERDSPRPAALASASAGAAGTLAAAVPGATPIQVGAGEVAWLTPAEDGTYSLNMAAVDRVCPPDAASDCAPMAPASPRRLPTVRTTLHSVLRDPSRRNLVVVTTGTKKASGGSLYVVAVPTEAPRATPATSAEPAAALDERSCNGQPSHRRMAVLARGRSVLIVAVAPLRMSSAAGRR